MVCARSSGKSGSNERSFSDRVRDMTRSFHDAGPGRSHPSCPGPAGLSTKQGLANIGGYLLDFACEVLPFEVGLAMTFPVIVHPSNGQFEAALVGAPDVHATASTREGALAALESAIA